MAALFRTLPPLAFVFICSLVLTSCGEDTGEAEIGTTEAPPLPAGEVEGNTVVAVIADEAELSLLASLLERTGLVSTLEGAGPFTVFAPTDASLEALTDATLGSLLESDNDPALRDLLQAHVVADELTAEEIADSVSAISLVDNVLQFELRDGAIYVEESGARVVRSIPTGNGVVHVIDGVILPADRSLAG